MHVAVCDDNVADRKQMERLLDRESDKRNAATGCGLYIDSYGNEKAIFAHPMLYDVFYIDMCRTEGITGADVCKRLIEEGVTAPIYLCVSDIDYRSMGLASNQIRFLDKPIKTAELCVTLDEAVDIKQSAIPRIELRGNEGTLYVTEAEIIRATQCGRGVLVQLTDGRTVTISDTCMNLFEILEPFEPFFAPNDKLILNGRHIARIDLFTVLMTDGKKHRIPSGCKQYAKKILEKY